MIKHILWKLISKSSCTMHIHQKISRFSMNPAMNSFESQVIKKYFLHTKAIVSLWVGETFTVSFPRQFFANSSLKCLFFFWVDKSAHGALPLERLANECASFLTVWSGVDLWAPLIGAALDSTRIMDAITQEQGPVSDSHSWQSFRDQ